MLHLSWLSLWPKGYKLVNLETNKIFISQDVQLRENLFPFHQRIRMCLNQPVLQCYNNKINNKNAQDENQRLEAQYDPWKSL